MYYSSGRKFVKISGKLEQLVDKTVIGDTEYLIKDNAPVPFVYGVKTICIKVYGDWCDTYDVISGVYRTKTIYKGDEWLSRTPSFKEDIDLTKQMDGELLPESSMAEKAKALRSIVSQYTLTDAQMVKVREFMLTGPTMSQAIKFLDDITTL